MLQLFLVSRDFFFLCKIFFKKGEIFLNAFMKRAIELAIQNVKEGGQPFGAVLVKDNEIVAEGVNELHKTHDVSGHAELLAVRRAQQKLQTDDLSGYTMYASGEPCPMCLAAMYFARIKEIYYSLSVDDAFSVGLETSKYIYEDLRKDKDDRKLKMTRIPFHYECENPLQLWQQRQNN